MSTEPDFSDDAGEWVPVQPGDTAYLWRAGTLAALIALGLWCVVTRGAVQSTTDRAVSPGQETSR